MESSHYESKLVQDILKYSYISLVIKIWQYVDTGLNRRCVIRPPHILWNSNGSFFPTHLPDYISSHRRHSSTYLIGLIGTSLDSYLLNILAYSFNANLEISYQVLDPPGLLRLSETNSLLSSKQYVPVSDFAKLLLLNTLGHSSKSGKSESTNDDDLSPLAPPTLQTTSFDWIALYPAEFADLEKDYITYVYASSNVSQAKHRKNSVSSALLQPSNTAKFQELYKARIESSRLKDLPGQSFCLVYMSRNKHCPQGYSLPFKVSFWRISQ
ncbi:unnamed protein product [Schistosoma mattheei]|uniref:SKICH domain-containing protein n=1 Tax=Schistosoma mattheei TaxID=31246 RepID=A0A183NKH4_9TREM|nr:unnamed protein product [Schistosoma mattheei]